MSLVVTRKKLPCRKAIKRNDMRENIGLFKAKRIDCNREVEGYFYKGNNLLMPQALADELGIDINTKHYFIRCIETGLDFEIDPETLCEYTGLKDKNGNKIFENDVLKNDAGFNFAAQYSFTCKFKEGAFIFTNAKYGINYGNTTEYLEIIGNKFSEVESE